MKKQFESISDKIYRIVAKYLDWLDTFDPIVAVVILLATLFIPAVLILSTANEIIVYNIKEDCLETESPRRYHDMICEQYIDSEWVKIDPDEKAPVYYYNDGAARIKGETND